MVMEAKITLQLLFPTYVFIVHRIWQSILHCYIEFHNLSIHANHYHYPHKNTIKKTLQTIQQLCSMDPYTITKCFNHTLKRKKLIFLLGALGFSTYTAYKAYNSPSMIRNRERAVKIFSALASITDFLGDSAETLGVISKDLKDFIKSDSDQIPASLKQVFKITKSQELSESIVRVSKALTIGILEGMHQNVHQNEHFGASFSDRALEKLFSPSGYGFVSVIVGSFSRNMVMAIYADREISNSNSNSNRRWVDVVTDDKVRKLIGDCIQQFVTTMVTVYLDKTIDINTYDEIISSLTSPKHEQQVRDLMALVCNGAVETLVRTSHQVLTNPNANANGGSDNRNSYLIRQSSSAIGKVIDQETVLSTLTGKVTVATVKSFVKCLLNRLYVGMKTRFLEAYRYFKAKSLVVMTVGISLYLHMFSGPRSLMPV